MWVDLTDAEVAAVVAAMREGSVVDKLCARPVLGAGAFIDAAIRKADEDFLVDGSGAVVRRTLGAYVMCWQWVSGKEAGAPTAYEPFYISSEVASRLKALKSFRLEHYEYPTDMTVEARGEYGGFRWIYQKFEHHWRLTHNDPLTLRLPWMCSEKLPENERYTTDSVMSSWLIAFDAFDQRELEPAQDASIVYRAELESLIYGDSSLSSLVKLFVASPESISSSAELHKSTMSLSENGLARSYGYGLPQPEIDAHHYARATRQDIFDNETVGNARCKTDMIFSVDLKLCATMYVRAPSLRKAQNILSDYKMSGLEISGDNIGESQFTSAFPEVEIAESTTIYGAFDGCFLRPRYDIRNDIDFD